MLRKLLLVLTTWLLVTQALAGVTGQTIQIQPVATVTWDQIVELDQKLGKAAAVQQRVIPYMPAPAPRELPAKTPLLNQSPAQQQKFASAQPDATLGPPLLTSFAALGDDNTFIPPDTHGGVGPNHLMTMLNSQVRIQNLAGGIISTVSLASFWLPAGASGPFDPRIIYDPGSGRWLATCDDDFLTAGSGVMFAISSTNNPTGAWTFYNIDADPTDVNFADRPDMGVNSTWIAITNNMFPIAGGPFSGAAMWVIDKSTALAGGPLTFTFFPVGFDVVAFSVYGFSLSVCLTFGAEPKLYLVDNTGWGVAGPPFMYMVRISEISGTGPAPGWSITPGSTFPGTGLFFVTNNFDGTQIDASQAGTASLVETNDFRMINAVFRNGRIWCTHSAGLPPGGPVDRTAVFWYQLDPTAMPAPEVQSGVLDGGVGVHHFFPSITANAIDDAMVGFSRSDASKFVEAVYTSRFGTDAPGTMDPISVLKLGEDSYIKDFGFGPIRWGDYSATAVDPNNDICMWTIQEYAALDVGPGSSDDRWGTWWGKICSCVAKPGDANANNTLGLEDIIAGANYVFSKPGCAPLPLCWLSNLLCRGDWEGNGSVGLSDVIRGANYIFNKPGGPWISVASGACCLPVP